MASLKLNDVDNKAGLFQEAERKLFNANYGRITDDTDTKKTFVVKFNSALDVIGGWIMNADTRWQYDDANYSTYPVFTETLVASQHDYQYEVDFLKVHKMAVVTNSGDLVYLEPVDPRDYEMPLEEFYETDGLPKVYDKTANAAKIYPAPAAADVTLSEGLQLWAQRVPDYFTINDTTKVPGIPSTFHEAVVTLACYTYATDNMLADKRTALFEELYNQADGWKARIEQHYSKRDVDDKPRFGVSKTRRLSKLK